MIMQTGYLCDGVAEEPCKHDRTLRKIWAETDGVDGGTCVLEHGAGMLDGLKSRCLR